MTTRQRGGRNRTWRRILTERRGAVAVLAALMLPAMIAFGPLFIDAGYLCFRTVLLRQTVHAAALAAAQTLNSYYTSGNNSTAAIVSAAQTFALANSPSKTYGTVVPAANVVVGNWNSATSTFTSLASSGGVAPNAVQVTGVSSAANGNPVKLFFAGLIGMPTMNLTSTAIASFATGQNFDTIIINDLSQSFKSEISEQRAADLAILNCVNASAGSATNFGITTFDGHASIYQPLLQASANLSSLETKINALNYCGTSGMPACSGSNAAAGIYSAIQQFSSVSSTNTAKNIVIITDGVPNASSGVTYAKADGTYATPTSTSPICSTNCTDANLLTMANDQATNAWAAGISVSTIYYTGDTATGNVATYEAELAGWRRGNGVSLIAPTAASISTVLGGFCGTMGSALKLVM